MPVGDDRFQEMASWNWSLNNVVFGKVMVEGPWDGCNMGYR